MDQIITVGFGPWRSQLILNNYWMRLSMISWTIKTEVCFICLSLRLRQITQTRGFDNSWYHVKTKFNNYFIIHFSHNSSSETDWSEAFSHFVSEESTPRGLVTRQTLNLTYKCNICSRYCIYHVKFTSYCKLIEYSRPIRFFIVSPGLSLRAGSRGFSLATGSLGPGYFDTERKYWKEKTASNYKIMN